MKKFINLTLMALTLTAMCLAITGCEKKDKEITDISKVTDAPKTPKTPKVPEAPKDHPAH